ncbi:uncharacterized protein K452DRAFT_283674 [Aplosporella prunicola CBS 121167]|uniref:Uncharacterized protein n=1 Tax=Aplosporella prunicola CBS 121167 TaxID=1176127 RepID=A0A6A6BMM6_9PEZI|nr:uncharacterized protein K452DRAFT_283674 [Aplosporella prunicola CBS 121167]KAF2145316.1 hypothetical protein K452DRAFT_283674 [Aplosporella prunicola CBS 121167]
MCILAAVRHLAAKSQYYAVIPAWEAFGENANRGKKTTGGHYSLKAAKDDDLGVCLGQSARER